MKREEIRKIFLKLFPTPRHFANFIMMITFAFVMHTSSDKLIVLISGLGAIYCYNEFSKRE
jgi:hypothetical protein